MEPVSLEKFLDQLDQELAWREKEIGNLKQKIAESASETDLRAGVVLLYAHWEGFVKSAAMKYIKFVASKKIMLKELQDCFIALALKKECRELGKSEKTTIYIKTVDFMLNRLSEQADITYEEDEEEIINSNLQEQKGKGKKPKKEIKTSNLRFDILKEILGTIGLSCSSYELKKNTIERLVNFRHAIAHGEQKYINKEITKELFTEIIQVIRDVQTDIFGAAEQKSYKWRANEPD